MLFVLVLIFTLGAVTYYIPRKTWHIIGMVLLFGIKYYIIGTKGCIHDWLNARYNKTDLPLKPGKIAIVTGGSRGIGAMVVKNLLQCDMEVVIACRTPAAAEKLILKIRESGVTSGQPKIYKLDNTSLQSIREFAKQIKSDYKEVHILINNAGIMFVPYRETEDGFEEQWQVNYLSHFLLTSLLMPVLEAGGCPGDCSRIINVTSIAHVLGTINFEDINCKDKFITHAAYAQSKLAQVMFSIMLQKLLSDKELNVQVYSVHPGIVNTDLFNNCFLGKAKWLMIGFKSPEEGATSIVYSAVNKNVGQRGGLYISNCREISILPMALDSHIQQQLFELSLKQTKLSNFFENR